MRDTLIIHATPLVVGLGLEPRSYGFGDRYFTIKLQPFMAEAVGFEPTNRSSRFPVFKTGAINLSATLP